MYSTKPTGAARPRPCRIQLNQRLSMVTGGEFDRHSVCMRVLENGCMDGINVAESARVISAERTRSMGLARGLCCGSMTRLRNESFWGD